MVKTEELCGMVWDVEDLDKTIDTLDPIMINQYPFVKEDMTVREYCIEKEYYGKHYKEFLAGTYKPLWKQKEA